MAFKPLKNNIACVRVKSKYETDTGIIIESDASNGADRARVFAIGPDVTLVNEKDLIIPDWTKVRMTNVEGNPIYILKEDDVNAIIEE